VDALIAEALGEIDDAKREQILIRGQRMALEDVALIPLHIQTNIWAMRRGLRHDARADESTRAQDIHAR
jgi:peptide/nickel transport system substrate-binding protein